MEGVFMRFTGLIGRRATWLAFGIAAAASLAHGILWVPTVSTPRPGMAATFALLNLLIGLLMLSLMAGIQLYLSRRRPGPDEPAVGGAAIGAWLGFTLLYLVLSKVPMEVGRGMFLVMARGDVRTFAVATVALALALRVCLFPLLVFLVAQARNAGRPGFAAILQRLMASPAIVAGYVALCVAMAAVALVPLAFAPGALGAASRPIFTLVGVAGAIGQVLLILYAIAAYDTLRWDEAPALEVFD